MNTLKKQNKAISKLKFLKITALFCFVLTATFLKSNPSFAAETLIAQGSDIQADPDIYHNKIVWVNYNSRSGNQDIYLYDLNTKQEQKITSDSYMQDSPSIYGDHIVWRDYRNGHADIYMYDLITKKETRITSNVSDQSNPIIYGDRIVWIDKRNGNPDIYSYSISSQTEEPVVTLPSVQESPDLYGDKLVWHERRDMYKSYEDVYLYDFNTKKETQITTDEVTIHQQNPSISGNVIAWQDYRNGNFDIYTYDLSTGVETRLTSEGYDQQAPKVDGNFVAWDHHDNQTGLESIYVYDLKNKIVKKVSKDFRDTFPTFALSGNKTVWSESNIITDADVHLYTIEPVTSLTTNIKPNNNNWFNTDVTVNLTVKPDLYNITKTEYRVNHGEWTSYTQPFTLLTEGTHTIEYRSTDTEGNIESTKSVQINIDKSAPTLGVQLSHTFLSPAKHQLVPIQAKIITSDTGSGIQSWQLNSIKSNQVDQSTEFGDRALDIQGAQLKTADTTFSLRAEFINGRRFYTISYTATDQAGNKTTVNKKVMVSAFF